MEAWLGGSSSGEAVLMGGKAPHFLSCCTFPELEIGQQAPATGEAKAQPLRTHDTFLSRMGIVRITGFAKSVTLLSPTPHPPPPLPAGSHCLYTSTKVSGTRTSWPSLDLPQVSASLSCMNPVIWSLGWGWGCRSPA